MKRKIKLRDLTKEQWDKHIVSLCKLNKGKNCDNCIFQWVCCEDSILRASWINHKEMYNDKFLDQEVEIDIPDILDEEEKRYLSAVIKPFRYRVVSIAKIGYNDRYFISIRIQSKFTLSKMEHTDLPIFNTDMYKGMENNKDYTLEELGL